MILRPLPRLQNDDPGVSGSEPIVDTAPLDTTPAAEPAPAAEPTDPTGLMGILDKVGADPAEPAPERPRDASGRFAPATPTEAKAPADPAQVPPAPTDKPATPPADDFTPPEGISERAQARWAQLTERAKLVPELERRATETQQALDGVRQMVAESGLQQQEFTEMLEMGRLFKSGNPQDLQRALQHIEGLRANVAQRLGVEVPGIDPLAQHADLQQKVQNMLLTREDALEIARLRTVGQQAERLTQEQREQQQHVQLVQNAAASMQATLEKRAGTPGHEGKLRHIHTYFSNPQNLQQFVTTYQPQQWEAALTLMYDSYTPPAPAPTPAGPQPLRPTNARAGAPVSTGPVTAMSAIENAFSQVGM